MPHSPDAPIAIPQASLTPAMRQYMDAKREHPRAIVFFRMGDFYEMFYEDALAAARALDLTLTSRSKDAAGAAIPMCGVPHHAADTYITRLVRKGYHVAICEQVEDPRKAKGVVRREVVRVVSPGTLTDASYLEAREPAFTVAITAVDSSPSDRPGSSAANSCTYGVALIDVSTGEFSAAEYGGPHALQTLADELAVLRPREVVVASGFDLARLIPSLADRSVPVTEVERWRFEPDAARKALLDQLRVVTLAGFGLDGRVAAVSAAGALLAHLRGTQRADLAHVRTVRLRSAADALLIDPTTLAHLEVVISSGGERQGSLLHEIDRTMTAMGGRLLRAWLLRPLIVLEAIRDRHDAVEELAFRTTDRGKLREILKGVQDLERLTARVALSTAGPRELVCIAQSLSASPRIRGLLAECQAPLVRSLVAELDDLADVRAAVDDTLVAEPPGVARDGGFVRDGADTEIDELRRISRSGKQVIAELEAAERERTGIQSLKVRFNRVFGYYIEVSKANLRAVPDDYQRKQTIAGGERFVTPALKDHETRVLGADERLVERELEVFEQLRRQVANEATRILDTARALAALDVIAGLAETATVCNYTRPHVDEGDAIVATDVRHPVVERRASGTFVSNDVMLDRAGPQLVILTGPNMGGKSTYLRQVAALCLLAQSGSFVPAREAKIGIVDRIYARVGASDNITRGQSTFMVEMQETAQILNGVTPRSLVVLDEIGRGTATFDGLSIAWAAAEHLAAAAGPRPRTLFATHYHELTDLADALPGVVNAHVTAREWRDEIIFLHKVLPGRSDRSYGIQVARLAGLPPSVIDRARAILHALEADELSRGGRPALSGSASTPAQQLGLFHAPGDADSRLRDRLRGLDLDRTTPLEALQMLAALKRDAE
ncbi:MAG: DNA mismatch repair protein MutS [Acidobacteriota bacterium]